MTQPVTSKGGKVRVLLDPAGTNTFTAPCGFTSKSLTITKALEDTNIPDCDDPDAVPWLGRDATSLSMSISGEGVAAQESIETWLDAVENVESISAKIEWEFPAKTITWTGNVHVGSFAADAPNGRRVTSTVSIESDGEMVRTVA